jgi:hypothetical protein
MRSASAWLRCMPCCRRLERRQIAQVRGPARRVDGRTKTALGMHGQQAACRSGASAAQASANWSSISLAASVSITTGSGAPVASGAASRAMRHAVSRVGKRGLIGRRL